MKRIFLILVTLVAIPAIAGTLRINGGSVRIGNGTLKLNAVVGEGGPPAATYLVDEDFELTGAPDGWTPVGSTVNFDAVIDTEALELIGDTESASAITPTFAATADVHVFFKIFVGGYPSGANRSMLILRNGTTELLELYVLTSGKLQFVGGSPTDDALPIDTWAYVWVSYNASTGAGSIGWSTDGTKPTSGTKYATVSQSPTASTTNVRFLSQFSGAGDPFTFGVDDVLVDDVAIGNNP